MVLVQLKLHSCYNYRGKPLSRNLIAVAQITSKAKIIQKILSNNVSADIAQSTTMREMLYKVD